MFLEVSVDPKLLNPKNTGAWKGRLKRFFVDPYAVELAEMVLISFEDIQKISNFCFMHKGVAQKLSLPHPFEV